MHFQHLRFMVFAALVMAGSQMSGAAQTCPWMTQGSAARLLGGDARATVQLADETQGSCSFARADGKASYSLDVVVSHDAAGSCPEGSIAIKGIGNEAQWCSLKGPSSESVERISSRVRDAFFTVTLSAPVPKDGGMTEEMRHDILNQAAELVAGNLF